VHEELDADEAQDGGEAVAEEDEAVEQSVDQKEELAQAEQRERVGWRLALVGSGSLDTW